MSNLHWSPRFAPTAGSRELDDCAVLASDLREARDLIVQLQRELERARGVIEQQRDVVRRATRLQQHRRRS